MRDHYTFLKSYLALAEKNKLVVTYKEIEKLKSMGGGDEDPYDKGFRDFIFESESLK